MHYGHRVHLPGRGVRRPAEDLHVPPRTAGHEPRGQVRQVRRREPVMQLQRAMRVLRLQDRMPERQVRVQIRDGTHGDCGRGPSMHCGKKSGRVIKDLGSSDDRSTGGDGSHVCDHLRRVTSI